MLETLKNFVVSGSVCARRARLASCEAKLEDARRKLDVLQDRAADDPTEPLAASLAAQESLIRALAATCEKLKGQVAEAQAEQFVSEVEALESEIQTATTNHENELRAALSAAIRALAVYAAFDRHDTLLSYGPRSIPARVAAQIEATGASLASRREWLDREIVSAFGAALAQPAPVDTAAQLKTKLQELKKNGPAGL